MSPHSLRVTRTVPAACESFDSTHPLDMCAQEEVVVVVVVEEEEEDYEVAASLVQFLYRLSTSVFRNASVAASPLG